MSLQRRVQAHAGNKGFTLEGWRVCKKTEETGNECPKAMVMTGVGLKNKKKGLPSSLPFILSRLEVYSLMSLTSEEGLVFSVVCMSVIHRYPQCFANLLDGSWSRWHLTIDAHTFCNSTLYGPPVQVLWRTRDESHCYLCFLVEIFQCAESMCL